MVSTTTNQLEASLALFVWNMNNVQKNSKQKKGTSRVEN